MRALIVGCGYVGLELGRELARQGHEVAGVRRSAEGADELRAAGIAPLTADVRRREELERLPGRWDWVVNCVSSEKGGVEEYRGVYLEGTRNLVSWLSGPGNAGLKKFAHLSSTSVYGQKDGSAVKESSETNPESETSRVLVEAEQELQAAAREKKFPALILRVAGIYGPGRGQLFLQYLKDEARISGGGERYLNMIHRDDVTGVILAVLQDGRPGEIYNAVDDEPVMEIDFFRWLSEELGREMPPFGGEERVGRKRGVTNKKVQNRKLKMELGYEFRYPNFRKGYTAEIQRLEEEGKIKD